MYKPEEIDVEQDETKRREAYSALPIHDRVSWLHQFRILLQRTWLDSTRSYAIVVTLLVQHILIALLMGGVFFQIGNTQDSVVKRFSALFFTVMNQGIFAALSVIHSFPSEQRRVLRERAAGSYYVSAYFLAKNLVDAAIQLGGSIVFFCDCVLYDWISKGCQQVFHIHAVYDFIFFNCDISCPSCI